jgi:pantoate--beta-alanine ligase
MQALAEGFRATGQTIAFVPTMGFLHDGHLSLMRIGRQKADVLVVSVFVNPKQFGPGEDFETYPRDLHRDMELIRPAGADVVFTPSVRDIYPPGFETYVSLDRLPKHLCGLSRPVFFRGVATVVTKLFNMVKPHVAVFGEKDFQQLLVIRTMVRDLGMGIAIVGGPIVREADGLAMSSRNSYLTGGQRPAALSLYRSLVQARQMVRSGQTDASRLIAAAADTIRAHAENVIDYVAVCDPASLEPIERLTGPALMALAVRVGTTRLIDNMILEPPGS